jgi:hypothetical protein
MENRDRDDKSSNIGQNRDFETNWNDEPSEGSESSGMESDRGRTGGSSSDIESDKDLGIDRGYGESGSSSDIEE